MRILKLMFCIFLIPCLIFTSGCGESSQEKAAREQAQKAQAEEQARKEKEKLLAAPQLNYQEASRYPDKYKGQPIQFYGKVLQVVLESGNNIELRISTKSTFLTGYDEDVVYVKYKKDNNEARILKDDMLRVYGIFTGITSYSNFFGKEIMIPSVSAKIVDMSAKPPDGSITLGEIAEGLKDAVEKGLKEGTAKNQKSSSNNSGKPVKNETKVNYPTSQPKTSFNSTLSYTNERYGFSIDYPSDFIREKPPANGDGLILKSADGKCTLTVTGSNYIESLESYEKAGKKASYKAKGDNWFVISWLENGDIYYQKTFAGKSSSNSMYLTYPESQKEQYTELVINLEKSFKPGNLNIGH